MNGNGERPAINGDRIPNGLQLPASDTPHIPPSIKLEKSSHPIATLSSHPDIPHLNGDYPQHDQRNSSSISAAENRSKAPLDILQLVPRDSYLPVATLIARATQSCWNGLSILVDQLASIQVPDRSDSDRILANGQINNQSEANLQKKERLMRFCYDQRNDFIKLAVLLDWSKNVDDVAKTISINYWLMRQRQAYWDAISSAAILRQEASGFQLPNPDLRTAAEILSRGRALHLPTLGYIPQKDLSNRKILSLLKSLNRKLSVKLALTDDLPPQLRKYHIHDGRVTFRVPQMFELDVSILDESQDSPFRMVDFRFSFFPTPKIPDSLRSEIEIYANSNIDRDGLHGCFLFLHELALSYKLAEYQKQALELSRTQWAGNLRVESIRRNLIIQYWTERQTPKSWIEIGISSGHHTEGIDKDMSLPHLDIKWIRHGKRVVDASLLTTQSTLCLEDILRQVIAQDSTRTIDGIYDSLILTPPFLQAELSLEQTLSNTDPEECSLVMQLLRSTYLTLRVEPVTGLVVISPVSEKSERLQLEINRIQGVAGEISTKLLNFRSSILESAILGAVAGTTWEVLRAFKLNQAETKSLFGGPVVRLNMLRQVQWGLDYFLAISHAHNGDHWWLLRQTQKSGPNTQTQLQVIQTQRIDVSKEISPAYFERLADYTTGLICLRRSAEYLSERSNKYEVPSLPEFDQTFQLPQISFPLDWARPNSSTRPFAGGIDTQKTLDRQKRGDSKLVRIQFEGVDPTSKEATFIAKMATTASTNTLRKLVDPPIDDHVILNPEERLITIKASTTITGTAIPSIIEKAIHLENLISTIQEIQRLPGVKLDSLSSTGITVVYHQRLREELSVRIVFGTSGQSPQLEFSPKDDNPHSILALQYSKILAMNDGAFSSKIRDLFTSLTMTYPILSFLHKLQRKEIVASKDEQDTSNPEVPDPLRVHVLARTAQHFAVQYFGILPQSAKDIGSDQQPQQLIARLEILPHSDKTRKPMWTVRPALEEFQAYARPSFSASALRTKLKQEVLTLTEPPKPWLALDNAAACLTDDPEPLLGAIHEVLKSFVKAANTAQVGAEGANKQTLNVKQGSGGTVSNGNPKSKTQNQNNASVSAQGQARPLGKMQAPGVGPNGVNKAPPQQHQRPNLGQGRSMPNKAMGKSGTPNNQDNPITLD